MSNQITAYDLHCGMQMRRQKERECFLDILEKCYTRIRRASTFYRQQSRCVYNVPHFMVGKPKYDVATCTAFLVRNLSRNGFTVHITPPGTLHISWDMGEGSSTSSNVASIGYGDETDPLKLGHPHCFRVPNPLPWQPPQQTLQHSPPPHPPPPPPPPPIASATMRPTSQKPQKHVPPSVQSFQSNQGQHRLPLPLPLPLSTQTRVPAQAAAPRHLPYASFHDFEPEQPPPPPTRFHRSIAEFKPSGKFRLRI